MFRSDAATPPVTIERDPARDAARAELADSIYAEAQPGLFTRVMMWVIDRLGEALDAILGGASSLAPGGAGSIVILAALLIALAIVIRLRAGRIARTGQEGVAALADRRMTAAHYRRSAAGAAAAHDYERAVHEGFLAIVRTLEERLILTDTSGLTATEIAMQASTRLAESEAELRTAARIFDDAYYGHHPVTARQYADVAAALERVRTAAPSLAAVSERS